MYQIPKELNIVKISKWANLLYLNALQAQSNYISDYSQMTGEGTKLVSQELDDEQDINIIPCTQISFKHGNGILKNKW